MFCCHFQGTDAVSKTAQALKNHTKLDKIQTTALDLNYTGNKMYRRLMELDEGNLLPYSQEHNRHADNNIMFFS